MKNKYPPFLILAILWLAAMTGCTKRWGPITPTGVAPGPSDPSPTPSPSPHFADDRIVYVGVYASSLQLFVIHPDGSGLQMLTDPSVTSGLFHPSWSPDKSQIAVVAEYKGRNGIYTLHSDGTGMTYIGPGITPSWSPDGTKIAFVGANNWIYTMNPDGSGIQQVSSGESAIAEPLVWSPDSRKLLYNTATGTKLINRDGTQVQNFPVTMMKDTDWSSNGKIAFDAIVGDYGSVTIWRIFTVNADGTGLTQVTSNTTVPYINPCWNHDGTKLVFGKSLNDPPVNLYVMDPDGSNEVPVPNGYIYYCYQACWH